jgi:hypothetical protein
MIAFDKWVTFQTRFMEGWDDFIQQIHSTDDSFWYHHQPAFHAYDYGANIQIEVNEEIANLEQETLITSHYDSNDCIDDNDSDRSDSDSQDAWGAQRQWLENPESGLFSPPSFISPLLQAEEQSEEGPIQPEVEQGEQEGEEFDQPTMATEPSRSTSSAPRRDHSHLRSSPSSTRPSEQIMDDTLYSVGLKRLREALESKYNLDNIGHVSYALAVDVHCTAASTDSDGDIGPAVCLLADRNRVAGEFYGSNYNFYPLGFHPVYGNFTSDHPPAFLDRNLFAIMKENMSYQNQGADVLSFGFFQGYSNLKRSIRHRPDDLLASHGLATAALTIPSTETQKKALLRDKQQRLLSQVRGELTPENPGASTPFARERQRIEAALNVNEFAFRFEQVVSIDAPRLIRQRRNFHSILQPIFQLMRLFLKEKQLYTGILRRFTPSIFPGILVAFAKVLEAAIGEMDRRFREGGSRGLGMALSEGVAALDRIGNFCFTGDPRVLPTKVMKLLGTIDSLRMCAWPYISPRMLDIREGRGLVNLVGWPQLSNGRPVLMHVASLEYHYNRSVAANRHSQLWFTELGGRSIDGLYRLNSFLSEIFHDIWTPETVSFVRQQAQRGLQRGIRSGESGLQNTNDPSTPRGRSMTALTAWEQQENPFRLSYAYHVSLLYHPIFLLWPYDPFSSRLQSNENTVNHLFCSEIEVSKSFQPKY